MKHCGEIPVILFANKVDLVGEGTVDDKNIESLFKEINIIDIYRTSAKTGHKVNEAFKKIIKELHKLHKK
jgi:GTPase SAR1 family protein